MKRILILITLLIGLNGVANAKVSGQDQAKVDMFAMQSESIVLKMEFFLVSPSKRSAIEIVEAMEPLKQTIRDVSEMSSMHGCLNDISCNFYFEIAMDNMDKVDYLWPKVYEVMMTNKY